MASMLIVLIRNAYEKPLRICFGFSPEGKLVGSTDGVERLTPG